MTNYICINGKKAELTEEQLKALGIELPKASPFERVEYEEKYYVIHGNGVVDELVETKSRFDKEAFDAANYCTDKAIMHQRALHETLNRLLWRFSMTHKEDRVGDTVWSIEYNPDEKEFHAGWTYYKKLFLGEVPFDTMKIAEQAIEEIVKPFMEAHPEFEL